MEIKTVAEFREKSCVAPFVHLSTDPRGSCHLCCWFDNTPIKKDDGTAFNFNYDRVEEIWKSNDYNKYRTIFLNQGPAAIPRCNEICMGHGDNKTSKRNALNSQFSDEDIQNIIDGKTVEFPSLIEVKITSLCNLKCQTCGPENSTQFFADKQFGDNYTAPMKTAFKVYLDTRAKPFLESILDNLDSINVLEFYGGEPFLIKDHKWFLSEIIKSGKAKDIQLRYITNGTIYDEDYRKLFAEFRSIIISVSMDSLFDKNEFIRLNSNWEEQIANILKYEEMLHEGSLESLNLNSTISLLTVLDYFDFIKYFDTLFKPHPRHTLSVSVLHGPADLQIKHLHPKQKAMWKFMKEKFVNTELKVYDKASVIEMLNTIEEKLNG